MAFCINCGQELAEGAKFCAGCGTAVNNNNSTTERKTTFEGEIHKCPSCGEILKSFVTNCPLCGYELRGTKATGVVKEFSELIQNTQDEQNKIELIRSFPIPNTKEDIKEFLILASSNIDEMCYGDTFNYDRNLSNAWLSKFDQAYNKAHFVFGLSEELTKIETLYASKIKRINKAKKKALHPILIYVLCMLPMLVLAFIFSYFGIGN